MEAEFRAKSDSGAASSISGPGQSSTKHSSAVTLHSEKTKRKSDLLHQKRGRKAFTTPNAKHLEILQATKTQTYEQVGAQYEVSKQRVGKIVGRWKEYLPIRLLTSRKLVGIKAEDQASRKKENRIHIISFRLTQTEVQLLHSRYPEKKSVDRAAREIVSKFLSI